MGIYASYDDIKLLFSRLDMNRDGRVRYSEFCNAIVPNDPYCASIVNRRNSNNIRGYYRDDCFTYTTRLDFKDLMRTMISVERDIELQRQRLSKYRLFNTYDSYKAVDLNGDSIVTINEIMTFLEENGQYVSPQDVTLLMERLDKDKDGRISYIEYTDELRP